MQVASPFPPAKFLDEDIINAYKNDYMFISCIDFIQQVKTGHFSEHSYQLWSISAVPSWSKINSGLVKMYQNEVSHTELQDLSNPVHYVLNYGNLDYSILSKFPIIQHVYFGNLMSFNSVKPGSTIPSARLGFLVPSAAPETQKTTLEENKSAESSKSEQDSNEQDSRNVKQHVLLNVTAKSAAESANK
ncbi:hypothetical protein DOY81_006687 [Sarcophaga bullata]|nr:hypothetical protein DOY81_006687 [Sarcophaga bullata]